MQTGHARKELEDFAALAPAAHAAIYALGKAITDSGLEKDLLELVKLRASQINGCTFCVQFHLNVARKHSVLQEKLDLVAVWKDADLFTPRERAALQWTEILTELAKNRVSDEEYAGINRHFSEKELFFLTAAIGQINVWNRFGVAFRFTPPVLNRASSGSAA
jgi:AhpD family alkylhydroperoxidase